MQQLIGFGTTFGFGTNGTGTSGTFTVIGIIEGITPPTSKIAKVSNDTFDSPTNTIGLPVEGFIMGWESPGQAKLKISYDSGGTQLASLEGIKGVLKEFQIKKTDGKGRIFPGAIMELGEEIPLKDRMMIDCTVELSGPSIPF